FIVNTVFSQRMSICSAVRVNKEVQEQAARRQPARRLRLSKNPRRAREGRSPLELPIAPSGVYGGRGTIFAPENPIFQSKNRFLAVFAPGNL
ncbi:MAG: hypothetical protein PUK86_06250, partial [bacterium]|nr:hypothetical protein [bacterium]